jgi:selenocysteine lyase/cysteine desulfurase
MVFLTSSINMCGKILTQTAPGSILRGIAADAGVSYLHQIGTGNQPGEACIMPALDFVLDGSIIYLNHAAVSSWPRRTAEAVKAFAEENAAFGAAHYSAWQEVENALRIQLGRLINAASANEIALLKSTSEALSVVAYGLSWVPGDNVVITSQEFPSNRIVWESLARFGVETRAAEIAGNASPEEAILARIDAHTRLVSVSSVQYATGLRLDLEKIGTVCRELDILFCVDAIQSLGAVELDVQACRADFVMADGHKWMMGPEGVALFTAAPESWTDWHCSSTAGTWSRIRASSTTRHGIQPPQQGGLNVAVRI